MTEHRDGIELTPLEIASGVILGVDDLTPSLPNPDHRRPVEVLEDELLQALTTPPCVVLFSGGRDSSCVLALATKVARRWSLPLPVPVTYRFPDDPEVDESTWQELVIGHLGIEDWVRIEFDDELDYVGPYAQRALSGVGPLWPPNGHMSLAGLDLARGGTLVTGLDGDGLFHWRWSEAVEVLSGRRRPSTAVLRPLAYYLAPAPLARAAGHVRRGLSAPWLRDPAQRELASAFADHRAAEPRTWRARIEYYNRMRYVAMLRANNRALARLCEAAMLNLFLEPQFISNFAARQGRLGFAGRTAIMTELFDGIVPSALLQRTDKPVFNLYWGAHSRELARAWSGEGIDASVVDPDSLAKEWAKPDPSFRSALLLQSAWLARQGIEEPVQGVR
jgi:Asparagine synthase